MNKIELVEFTSAYTFVLVVVAAAAAVVTALDHSRQLSKSIEQQKSKTNLNIALAQTVLNNNFQYIDNKEMNSDEEAKQLENEILNDY